MSLLVSIFFGAAELILKLLGLRRRNTAQQAVDVERKIAQDVADTPTDQQTIDDLKSGKF